MAALSQYDIHSICRICLQALDNDDAYDLFRIPGLAKKLQLCTSLSVEPQDGYPKNLCSFCYSRLNELHDFQKQCVDSVQKFQEMMTNNVINTGPPCFDILETGTDVVGDINHTAPDDDDRLNFDPLFNHKMELIENEEDVFKMLEHVDKDVKEVVESPNLGKNEIDEKEKICVDTNEQDKELNDNESLSDFGTDDDDDYNPDIKSPEKSNDSDDDLPLVLRLRKSKEGDSFKVRPGPKPKRKRIPAKERHLHTIIDCHICHQKFKKVIRYQEHMKYHNDELPHQCTVATCLKGFTTANALRLHVEHAHTETVECIPCPEEGCGRTFPRTRLLNWHLNKVHNILREPKNFPCTECDKVFRCQMALKKHMYKHDGKELPFPCNVCDKRFMTNSALKDHLMRHAGIKNYVCPYCGVGKTTRQEWNIHINTHTQEKKFRCHLCPHASHNKQYLRSHIKIVHEKIKDFACQYCGKTFGKSSACKSHEMTHTGEKRCECKVCGKQFAYTEGLTKHMKIHEKGVCRVRKSNKKKDDFYVEKNVEKADVSAILEPEIKTKINSPQEILKVCEEYRSSLQKDKRRVERVNITQLAGTAVNPIPSVSVPSWSPQTKPMMKEGPYICPECGKHFNVKGNMKKHYRIVHEGVKDFACQFCHRRFAKAETLKHHEMTHTGERPYECAQCGKRFIQSVVLKRHMKVHGKIPQSEEQSPQLYESLKTTDSTA